jgi:hypothetical protein
MGDAQAGVRDSQQDFRVEGAVYCRRLMALARLELHGHDLARELLKEQPLGFRTASLVRLLPGAV